MLEVRQPHPRTHHRHFRLQILHINSVFHQVFGESSREEIEQGVSGLALGFVGLAVGAGIAHFTAVSHYFCYYIYPESLLLLLYLPSYYFCYYIYPVTTYVTIFTLRQPTTLCLVSSTDLQSFSLATAGERLTKRIRLKTFQAMLRQDISWYDHRGHSTGALTTRLAVDAADVKGVSRPTAKS